MSGARRAIAVVKYLGVDITQDIAPYLLSFTYNDNEGKSDEIQIDLEDRDRKWQSIWLPQKGDTITASIRLENWHAEGEVSQLNCGTFYIDSVNFKGPPDTLSIKALSVPFAKGGKNTKYTRAWENAKLSSILSDIATSAGLTLLYDAPDFSYDRVDQQNETDLSFAQRIAKKEGLATKVTDNQLVIYDESKYENKTVYRTIKRGESDVKSYSFEENAADEQYKQVEVSYFDSTKNKTIKYVYNVPGVEEGPTLKINQRVKSYDEAMRVAKAAARKKNKGAKKGKLTMMGDENLVQGVTINIANFGAFDGKYYIESTSHKVTGGYTADINIREVLSY